MGNLNALILPGETAPRRSSLRRQLLFFDSVLLVHPDDAAVVNDGDVEESFASGLTVRWTTRAPFPQSEEYRDSMRGLIAETERLQRSGKVRVLRPEGVRPRLDPGIFFTSYMTAIADASLVRAAIPDVSAAAPPYTMPSGVYAGMGVYPSGERSLYEVDAAPPAELEGVDHRWNALGWVRVGRAMKFIRRATVERACCVALDAPNAGVCLALGARAFDTALTAAEMAELAVSLDAVDDVALDRALVDASWDDVLDLRKNILPKVAALRTTLEKSVRIAKRRPTVETYRAELVTLRADLEKKREALAAEWNKVGLGMVGKALGGAATVSSLASLALPTSIAGVLGAVVTGGLAAGGYIATETRAWLTARQVVKSHPLFFFDTLPETTKKLGAR